MNIKILLKTLAAVVGVYELMDLSYQLGKGRILGIMKEHDLNANEALDAIKACATKESFGKRERINLKIIEFMAKL